MKADTSFVIIPSFEIIILKYSKTPLYCPSIHCQTRVSPRISAVPFSVCSNNPVKMPNSHTATVIEDQTVNLLLFKPRS